MIVTSCPLRVSLVGGSTDHPQYIEQYGQGAVISFPSSLRVYVTLHQDYFGINSIEENYNISYSRRETAKNISDIKNEMVRHCFEYLNVPQINCNLMSDIYSVGSGLAASSAYLQALIKSVYVWRKQAITDFEICQIAENVERKFNPLVGQQDFYGSMGGLKRIDFYKGYAPTFKYLTPAIFSKMEMYLLYTGVLRNSTSILETLDVSKSLPLMRDVEELEQAITTQDVIKFNQIMQRSWENKKNTSSLICDNEKLVELDHKLYNDSKVLSHKLCGAGNGGYFLIFAHVGAQLEETYNTIRKIGVSESGLTHTNLNEFTRI